MMRILGLCCLFGGAAASVYPGNAAAAEGVISGALKSAASAFAASGNGAANEAKMIAASTQALAESVSSAMSLDALKKDAFIMAHVAARKFLATGGCARDFSGCPAGFVADAGTCTPGMYDGTCGAFSASMDAATKAEWSWKCGASWPCA